ncbi:hypothetical protein ACFQY4_17960 [Catellatospora bangladeshensis]|uniref:hypothetical protein n=1 Tax=Catellatospora bangladeshensis TaxID=310355 RepID=UPI00194111F0|nr:hypothetical protein [Catellatospora bangladeshensis]
MFKRTNKARRDDLGMLRASDIRTLMGLWIWYQIIGDKDSARALPDSLPEGDRDELAFMEAAFGIAIRGQAKKGWSDARFQSLAS